MRAMHGRARVGAAGAMVVVHAPTIRAPCDNCPMHRSAPPARPRRGRARSPRAQRGARRSETVTRACPPGGFVCRKGETRRALDRRDRRPGEDDQRVRRRQADDLHRHRARRLVRRRLAAQGRAAPLRHRRAARQRDRVHAARDVHVAARHAASRSTASCSCSSTSGSAQFIAHGRARPPARTRRARRALRSPRCSTRCCIPASAPTLPISQEEIGQLAGLSRQRANQALQVLEQAGLLRDRLRRHHRARPRRPAQLRGLTPPRAGPRRPR